MKARQIVAALAAAVLINAPALVAPAAAFEVVSDAELSEMRGGVLVAGDLAFQFGAVIRTFESGLLSLQTQVTWTPAGPHVEQVMGEGVTTLADAQLAALSGAGGAFLTPGGAAVTHQFSQGQLVNLLMNTNSNRDFQQDIAITLVLPGFEAVQTDMVRQLTGLRIWDDVATSSVGALGQ